MKINRILINLIFVFSVLVLSGCGKEKAYDINTKTALNKNSDIVTISFFICNNTAEINSIKKAIDLFEINNPKIKVRLVSDNYNDYDDAVAKMMLRGNQTDIMQISYDDYEKYQKDGAFYNLNNLTKIIDTESIDTKILKLGKINNNLFAIPISLSSDFPVYNKTMLEKYRFELPDNLDDHKNYVKDLRPYKIYPFGMDKTDTMLWIIAYYEQVYGFSPYDKDGRESINKDYLSDILEQYKRLVDLKAICPINEYNDSLFIEGKVMGTIINSFELYTLETELNRKNQEVIVSDYFKAKNVKHSGIYYKPSAVYVMDENTSHPIEAATFLNFLLHNNDCTVLLKTQNGIPASNIAEKTLIENGLISECEFLADLSIDFNFYDASIRPIILEDEEYVNKCIDIINFLVDDKITSIEAASLISEIK